MNADDTEQQLQAEAAVRWLSRLENASVQERAQFWAWLANSPQHVREALLARATDLVLGHALRDARIEFTATRTPQSNVHVLPPRSGATSESFAAEGAAVSGLPPHAARDRAPRTRWQMAAAIAGVTLLTLATVGLQSSTERPIVTGASEWRTVRLPDGSLVRAGPRTQLSTEFTVEHRLVRLEAGEALFEVAKDPEHPFIVSTRLGSAQAVGTEFAVSRLEPHTMMITVREGMVAVHRAQMKPSAERTGSERPADSAATLRAGDQVRLRDEGPLVVEQVDIERQLAWTDRSFVFIQTPLKDAVREFNLRNRMRLEIADPALDTLGVTATYEADQPRELVRELEREGRISSIAVDDETIRILPPALPRR